MRGRRRTLLRAGIVASSFDTRRTLVLGQGLTDDQAIEVALRLAGECPAAAVQDWTDAVVAGR